MLKKLFLATLVFGSLPMSITSAQNTTFFSRNFPLATEGKYLGSPACMIQTYWQISYDLNKLCQPAMTKDNPSSVQTPLPITSQNSPEKSPNSPPQNNPNPSPNSSSPSTDNSMNSKTSNTPPPAVLVQPTTQPSIYQRFTGVQPKP